MEKIILRKLTKISLNKWYAGVHWSERNRIKNEYKIIIKSQYKNVFPKNKKYFVEYDFFFKNKPLDASNCVAMVKLIEDIIFEDDKFDIIIGIKISSRKNKDERVEIGVKEL